MTSRIASRNRVAGHGARKGVRWIGVFAASMVVAAAVAGSAAGQAAVGCPEFEDHFDYGFNPKVNDLDNWFATTSTQQQVLVPRVDSATGVAVLYQGNGYPYLPNSYIRPKCEDDDTPLSWPLDRTCRRFTRCEFTLSANVNAVNSPGNPPEGRFEVIFQPKHTDVNHDKPKNDNGNYPLVAFDLVVDGQGPAQTLKLEVYSKDSAGSNPPMVGSSMPLGAFTSAKRFAVEFGWDYYTTPIQHGTNSGGDRDHKGLAWLYGRFSVFDDVTQTWGVVGGSDESNGWMEFGTYELHCDVGTIPMPPEEIGVDFYEWDDSDGLADLNVTRFFPYFLAQQIGAQAQVNWAVDDVHLWGPYPQPFVIQVDTLGYDIAGRQWALLRPNIADFQAIDALDTVTVKLLDSTGLIELRSCTVTAPLPGQSCFREPVNYEDFDDLDSEGFDYRDCYWWRVDWEPVTEEFEDCFLRVTLTTKPVAAWEGHRYEDYTFDSARFDIKEEIHHRSLWPTLGLANALQRVPANVVASEHCYRISGADPDDDEDRRQDHVPFGGWYDASGQNGEARAEATFVSAFCHLLEQRRPELTTDDVRSLIQTIKEGADFLYLEGKDQNNDADRLDPDTGHIDESVFPLECDHYLNKVNANDVSRRGHVFEEHEIRPYGHQGGGTGADASDKTNNIKKVVVAGYAFADVARVMDGYEPSYASSFRTQAIDTRDYLYSVNEHCTPGSPAWDDKNVAYRSQAGLDALLAALSDPVPAPEDPDYPDDEYMTSLDAAKRKLALDLSEFDPWPSNSSRSTLAHWVLDGPEDGVARLHPGRAIPAEALIYFVENDVANDTSYLHTWREALRAIADHWYVDVCLPTGGEAENPFRVPAWWDDLEDDWDYQAFRGDSAQGETLCMEAQAVARIALALRHGDPTFQGSTTDQSLEDLAIGAVNWQLGLHFGLRGRFATPSSDLEFAGASLASNLTSLHAHHVWIGIHQWTHPTFVHAPTLVQGQGGAPPAEDELNPGTYLGSKWAPWDYSVFDYNSSESYIKRDGNLLIAAEALGRLLHPRLVLEAENPDRDSEGSSEIDTESNNVPGSPNAEDGLLNGGTSVVNIGQNDWLEYDFTTPEAGTGNYEYTILLRVANFEDDGLASDEQIEVKIDEGAAQGFTQTIAFPRTGSEHDYEVLALSLRVILSSGVQHKIRVTFLGLTPQYAFDDIVLRSSGVVAQ